MEQEIKTKLDAYLTANPLQPGEKLNLVAYSGSGDATLEVIEKYGYPVDTMVFLGSPTIRGSMIEGSELHNIQRVINIYGENDPIPLAGGTYNKSFTGSEVFNIKLLGVNHFQYFPDSGGALTTGAARFVKQAILAAGEEDNEELLHLLNVPSDNQSIQEFYVVDPDQF